MKSALPRFVLALVGLAAGQATFAQTYVGSLDGGSTNSTLELNSTVSLPSLGWTTLTGSPRIFDATNDAIINGDGLNYSPFSVQYLTSDTLVANSTYTLSFRMGYFSGPAAGTANYEFSLGTWNGSSFTPLNTASGGPVVYLGSFSGDGSNGVTESLSYTTGTSVSSDVIAVRWAQTNDSTGGPDFFGFDNATLSYTASAIPEPSTYAALLGVGALSLVARRRWRKPARS